MFYVSPLRYRRQVVRPYGHRTRSCNTMPLTYLLPSAGIQTLALMSSNSALSLSISVFCCGQLMPRPSCALGLGICTLVNCHFRPGSNKHSGSTYHMEMHLLFRSSHQHVSNVRATLFVDPPVHVVYSHVQPPGAPRGRCSAGCCTPARLSLRRASWRWAVVQRQLYLVSPQSR